MSSNKGSSYSEPRTASTRRGPERFWDTTVAHDLAFLLARANALSLARMHAEIEPHGLKARSYSILSLAAAGMLPSQRELSEFLRLDPSQIVTLIDDLEQRGLVIRESDPRDRRANVVVATEEGHKLAEESRIAVMNSEAEWFSALPEEDQISLRRILGVLAAAR